MIQKFIMIGLLLFSHTACVAENPSRYSQQYDSMPKQPKNVDQVKNAVPKIEPRSRYGNSPSYQVADKTYTVLKTAKGYQAKGLASWYGSKFQGHRTSNGETYDMYKMTAAHKSLPLPSYVQVTHLKNKRSVIVRVNDRGPFHDKRLIDLSYAAAKKLGITKTGTAMVKIKSVFPSILKANQDTTKIKPFLNRKIIQVGAYQNKDNALKKKQEIQKLIKYPVIIEEVKQNKSVLYRVQISHLKTVDDFQKVIEILVNKKLDYNIW